MQGRDHKGEKIKVGTRRKQSIAQKGKKHWRWKGVMTKERIMDRIRHGLDYKLWREKVCKRDGHKCKICSSEKYIIAHHIKSFDDYPELRFDTDNGLTVCGRCHVNVHKKNSSYR